MGHSYRDSRLDDYVQILLIPSVLSKGIGSLSRLIYYSVHFSKLIYLVRLFSE